MMMCVEEEVNPARGPEDDALFASETAAAEKQPPTPQPAAPTEQQSIQSTAAAAAATELFEGWSAFDIAAAEGDCDALQVLLAQNGDRRCGEETAPEETPLALAASAGHSGAVSMLLLHSNFGFEAAKNAALYAAARAGHSDVVDQLLSAGASATWTVSDGGDCAVVAAARGGHATVLQRLLLESSANSERQTQIDEALTAAVTFGRVEAAETLLKHNAAAMPPSVLALAARLGHAEIVTALLEHGADVAGTDSTGKTALWNAAFEGHALIVDILLQHSAPLGNAAGLERRLTVSAMGKLLKGAL